MGSVTGIALALGTSAAYGLSNFFGPLLGRRYALGAVLLTGQLAALVAAVVALALAGDGFPGSHGAWLGAAAGVSNAIGLAGFYRAAELGPLAVAAPIGATGAVLPVIYGLATGERLGKLEAIGIVFAIGGVVLAARRPSSGDPDAADVADSLAARENRSGSEDAAHSLAEREGDLRGCVIFSLVSAVGFGGLLILLPQASQDGRWWALLDARVALVAFLVVLFAARRQLAAPPDARSGALMALPGLGLILGTLLYVLAGEHGSLSVVAVIASLNPVFTVGLAFVVLGERLSRIQALGVAAAIAGVVLVAA